MKRKLTLQNKHWGYKNQLLTCLLACFASTAYGKFIYGVNLIAVPLQPVKPWVSLGLSPLDDKVSTMTDLEWRLSSP